MSLAGDRVENWQPIEFAVAFTRAMRRHKAIAHRPSLRTSLAIPRFLIARWARTQELAPKDYLQAAVLCTPPEDQGIARAIAHSLLFPEEKESKKVKVETAQPAAQPAEGADPFADLLGDLASVDMDMLDLDSLDALLEDDEEEEDEDLAAFDLFETLYSSAFPAQRALGELIMLFGGPAELQQSGVHTMELARATVETLLEAQAGELTPEQVLWSCQAGFGDFLLASIEKPWVLAGFLAGTENLKALAAHLDDLLDQGSDRDRGQTLAYLRPHAVDVEEFTAQALEEADDLTGHAELLVGLQDWIEPPTELLEESAIENPRRALEAASWLEREFAQDRREAVLTAWSESLPAPPRLERLCEVAVDCEHWHDLASQALPEHLAELDAAGSGSAQRPLPEILVRSILIAGECQKQGFQKAQEIASGLANEILVRIDFGPAFLPALDELIERGAMPTDIEAIVAVALQLGIADSEIYDRLGKALEQLRVMVMANTRDADRYQRLVERISGMPEEMMNQLCNTAVATGNLEAMAALLAVNMGAASMLLTDEDVMNAVGYKGIGGGSNLLSQWFSHRGQIRDGLRTQLRIVAKAALMDLAFDWMGKGQGTTEQGLIPQNSSRPFRAGDGLDALDIEATLDAIVSSGKTMDQVGLDDLFVADRARGQAGFSVLIDISGSMSGSELAICAIAVVMLLGKLRSEEVSLAVFESNTHVLKGFQDPADLDEIAEKVLDLEATGGTRVDAALGWAAEQFEGLAEADVRVLFLLSDFAFFEEEQALVKRGMELGNLGVRLLAASHSWYQKSTLKTLLDAVGGEHVELKDVRRLPEVLLGTLQQIADSR